MLVNGHTLGLHLHVKVRTIWLLIPCIYPVLKGLNLKLEKKNPAKHENVFACEIMGKVSSYISLKAAANEGIN